MSGITTHVLDVSRGRPGAGIAVRLEQVDPAGHARIIARGVTNDDGRCANLLAGDFKLSAGAYRLHFDVGDYFRKQHVAAFYPVVEVTFQVAEPGEHHHVPLLLSPFSYSTYRGS